MEIERYNMGHKQYTRVLASIPSNSEDSLRHNKSLYAIQDTRGRSSPIPLVLIYNGTYF